MKPWYSYKGKKYEGDAPPYFDLRGTEWYDRLQQSLPRIQQLAGAFLTLDDVHLQEYFNKMLVAGTRWDTVSFLFWGYCNAGNMAKAPELVSLFDHIPGLVSLSISVLQPHTHIKGHHGDTDAIYRIHIPVFVPAGLPDCGFTVSGITRPWLNDEMIVFCDAHFHEAWNVTGKPRAVLIIDVMRPEFLTQQKDVCANVLSFLKYQVFSGMFPVVRRLPGWAKDITRRFLKRFYPIAQLAKV